MAGSGVGIWTIVDPKDAAAAGRELQALEKRKSWIERGFTFTPPWHSVTHGWEVVPPGERKLVYERGAVVHMMADLEKKYPLP
jgi:hypothetical protein